LYRSVLETFRNSIDKVYSKIGNKNQIKYVLLLIQLCLFYYYCTIGYYFRPQKAIIGPIFTRKLKNADAYSTKGDRGGTVVKMLCYKSEGRWFDPNWYHWSFSLT